MDSENEAAAFSESSVFTFRRDPQKTPKMDPNLSLNGCQIRPKTCRGRSKSGPEKVSKNDTEIGAKREPKWDPKTIKNREKGYPKTRSITGRPLGRPRVDIGATLGPIFAIFKCILVFPHVFFNVFHVKTGVFLCVYDDLALRFFLCFWEL